MITDNKIDMILATIKEFYISRKEPVPVWVIHAKHKNIKPQSVKSSIIYLMRHGKVHFDYATGNCTPILTEEEKAVVEDKRIYVTEDKIRDCIRSFFRLNSEYPTSSDVENQFIKMFGKPEMKDIERYVRKLAEEGKLKRTEDFKYYFDTIGSQERTLRGYIC